MSRGIMRGFHPVAGAIDLLADKLAKYLITQPPEHYMTHEGKHFTLAHYFADIDTDGYGRIRFKTPTDQYLHAVFFIKASLGAVFTIYRDPDFTHNGSNALTSVNRNEPQRAAITDPLQEACHTPSGSGAGDVFLPTTPIGTGGQQAFAGAGTGRDINEVILDLDTVYLVEAQSLSDNNKVTIGCDFYYRSAS